MDFGEESTAEGCDDSSEELIRSAESGDVESVRSLLRDGTNPDLRDDAGNTALACAGPPGRTDVVTVLLDAGADPETTARDGDSVLLDGITFCRTQVVESLVSHGAATDRMTESGNRPLDVAVDTWQPEMIRILLDGGADPHELRPPDRGLWRTDGTPESWPPNACEEPTGPVKASVLLVLLDEGAEPTTVLERAMIEGQPEPVRRALDLGADPNAGQHLALASARGDRDIVELLLAGGADPAGPGGGDLSRESQWCHLVLSSPGGVPDDAIVCTITTRLRSADPRFDDSDGPPPVATESVPLIEAAGQGGPDIVALLLDARADPNAVGEYGYTPLHGAALAGDLATVQLLLAAGATPPTTDAPAPSDFAAGAGHDELAAALRALDA